MGQCWLQGAASHRAWGGGGYYTVNANGGCREHKQAYWHAEFVCFRRVILGQRLNQDTLLTSVKGQFDISQQEHRQQPPNNAALFLYHTKVIGLGYLNKSKGVTKQRTLVKMTLWHTRAHGCVIRVLECAQASQSCALIFTKLDVEILLPMREAGDMSSRSKLIQV